MFFLLIPLKLQQSAPERLQHSSKLACGLFSPVLASLVRQASGACHFPLHFYNPLAQGLPKRQAGAPAARMARSGLDLDVAHELVAQLGRLGGVLGCFDGCSAALGAVGAPALRGQLRGRHRLRAPASLSFQQPCDLSKIAAIKKSPHQPSLCKDTSLSAGALQAHIPNSGLCKPFKSPSTPRGAQHMSSPHLGMARPSDRGSLRLC